tara:strand:- start:543 stop:1580 length:1038 start_codon:yes stop_codon:yes gene_type:complete
VSDNIILPNGLTLPIIGKKSGNTFQPWTGAKSPFSHKNYIEIIDATKNIEESNSIALNALNNGASSLMIQIKSHKDLPTILGEIRLDICPIHFKGHVDPELISESIKSLPDSQNPSEWHGSLNFDLPKNAIARGNWFLDFPEKCIMESNLNIPKNVRTICSHADSIYRDNSVDQVAFAISSLIIQLDIIGWEKSDRCIIFIRSYSNYLETIAMTQAIRILWNSILRKNKRIHSSLWICGETSSNIEKDPPKQLIARGIEAQSLWLGGCDEIIIHPVEMSSKAKQWARDQFLILAYETGLAKERDILKGSYLLDEWSQKIILAAEIKIAKWTSNHSLIEEIQNKKL